MTKQTNEIKIKTKAQQQDEALIREAPPELHLLTVGGKTHFFHELLRDLFSLDQDAVEVFLQPKTKECSSTIHNNNGVDL